MDLTIPENVEKVRGMLRMLGKTRLRPLGIEADRSGHALPSDHPFFREALGFGMTGGFTGPLDQPDKQRDPNRPRSAARRAVILAEEAAYWDRGMATSMPGPSLGGPPVYLMGTPEQKQKYLGIFEGAKEPCWAAFAMSEPGAGSDVAALRTRARKDGDHWVIDGEKMFISNGNRASWVVVWATIDPTQGRAGHRAFIVERGTPGFKVARVDKKMGLTASETASLTFENCRIPAENLLGGEHTAGKEGFKGAMATFNITRPIVGAMAIGIGRAAYDEARRFARDNFTGVSAHRMYRARERLGTIRRKLEAGRLLAWHAAWLADHKKPNAAEASMAKAYGPPVALEAASLGMDILAEAGAASDYLIEKLYRDVKVLDIVEGTGQIQRLVMARQLINHGAPHE
ncbi:MAG: acyl-CoA dehydrogenase family protein [Kofleriaceae bacterium]